MSMLALLFAATVYTAKQGTAVQLEFPNEQHVKSVAVTWHGKTVPAFRTGDAWRTFVGVDVETKPGAEHAEAVMTMDDGRVERRDVTIDVVAKKFEVSRLNVAEKFVEPNKLEAQRAARESHEVDALYGRITTDIVPDEPFTVPIPGETGKNFGERRIFNGEPRAPHSGSDLRASVGTPVHATNRARVVLAKNLYFTGNTVLLDHGFGIYSLYAHLSRIDVRPGQIVKNGQVVGLAGATGRVTAPHLHWGMRVQGARVDPFSLVGR